MASRKRPVAWRKTVRRHPARRGPLAVVDELHAHLGPRSSLSDDVRLFWAVQRGEDGMPCLFGNALAALENKEADERVVLVALSIVQVAR